MQTGVFYFLNPAFEILGVLPGADPLLQHVMDFVEAGDGPEFPADDLHDDEA